MAVDIQINPALPYPYYQEPWLGVWTCFYDETGRAGLVDPAYPYFPVPGAKTEIFFDGNPTPAYTSNAPYFYGVNVPETFRGKPFTFRITIPTLGVFEGTDYVEGGYKSMQQSHAYYGPVFVIPTTPSDLGEPLTVPSAPYTDRIPPNGQWEGIYVYLNVASGGSGVCYAVDFHALQESVAPHVRVTVDYLLGCNLEEQGQQSAVFTTLFDGVNDANPRISWQGSPLSPWPSFVKFGEIAPTGPIRMSVGVDGYTTDTVTFEARNLRIYRWHAFLEPLPPPGGGDYPGGLTFAHTAVSIFPEIIQAVEGKIPPTIPMDHNGDGAVDIADLIYFLNAPTYTPLSGGNP